MNLYVLEVVYDFGKMWRVARILLPFIIILIVYYNIMLKKENGIKNAFSTIDVMYKKRNDLIPNLVNTVKGYMQYEKDVLTKICELRNNVPNKNDKEYISTNDDISNYINNILLLSENYPNLKANENFLSLQKTLRDIEELLSAARRTYNAHVTSYNTFISIVPNILFAKLFGFHKYQLFEVDKKTREGKIYYHED